MAATPIGRDVRAVDVLLLGVAAERGVAAAVVGVGRARAEGRARGVAMVDEGVAGGRTRPVTPPTRCADEGAAPATLLGPAPSAVASFVGFALLIGAGRGTCLGVPANASSSFPLSAPGLTLIEA